MVVIHHEEVIEVSADLLGRLHGGKEAELMPVGERRKESGQLAALNRIGHGKLGPDTFLLCRNPLHLIHILQRFRRERGKRFCQYLDLISGTVFIFHHKLQILSPERVHFLGHALQGVYDPFGNRERCHATQNQDSQNQDDDGLFRSVQALVEDGFGFA